MITVNEALAHLFALTSPLPVEEVKLSDSSLRTLARPVKALRDQPPFSASAMDGYGVREDDARPGATLRERLSGSAVVPEWHPAHAYRGAFAGSRTAADGGASLVPTTV